MKCPQLYQALPLCVHVSACFSSLSLFLQFFVYDLRVMETFMGYIMVPKFLLEEISCSEGNKILFTKKKKKKWPFWCHKHHPSWSFFPLDAQLNI